MAYREWGAAGKQRFFALVSGVALVVSLASCTEPNEGFPPGHGGASGGGAGGGTMVIMNPDASTDGNGDGRGDVATGAHLVLDSSSHDFGKVTINGLGPAADFVITNDGGATSGTLGTTLIPGAGFSVKTDGCVGKQLAPGASCRVTVIFSPTTVGVVMGSIRFTAPGFDATATLTAEAITPGALKIVPDTQNFGPVVPPAPGSSQTFTVTNTGQEKSGVIATSLGGTDAPSFQNTGDGCKSQTLASGQSCQIVVRFAPLATMLGPKAISLNVTADPGGTAVALLSGNAISPGQVMIAPGTMDFGSVQQNKAGTSKAFTVQNKGQAATAPLSVSVSTNEFIVDDGCKNQVLAANAMCTVNVTFMPLTPGSKLSALTVTELGGGSATAQLTGISLANPALKISPASKDFPNVLLGSPATVTFQVTNDGGVASSAPTATISGTDLADFTIPAATNGCTAAIPAGGMCMLVVRFLPTTMGSKAATLTVAATAGGMVTAALTGTAITAGQLKLNLTTFDFHGVEQGTGSSPATFTVTNTGQTITGLVSGRIVGSAVFTVVSDLCKNMMLAPGNSCSLTVRFDPVAAGPVSSTLEIAASPGGTATASLSGTGLAPPSLSINPTAFTFPATVIGATSAVQSFTVTNTGGVAAGTSTALAVALTRTDAAEFKIVNSNCTGALAAGNSCMVAVAFTPKTAGDKTASVAVTATPGGAPMAAIAGRAQNPARLALTVASGSSSAFGNIPVNTPSDKTFVVTNTGDQSSSAVGITVTSAAGSGFVLLAPTTGECVPGTTILAGAASCNVRVRFLPTVAGNQSATLGAAATTGGTASLGLTGTGQRPAALTGSNSNNFGTVLVNTTTGTVNWTILNSGDVATSVPTLTNSNSAEVIANNGCTGAIPGGGSCTIGVAMKPIGMGARTGTLTLTAAQGGSVTFVATASGQTVAGLGLAPLAGSSTNFGDVLVGASVVQTFQVSNAGQQPTTAITITLTTAATSGFALVTPPTTGECVPGVTVLAGLTSCNVRVRFTAPAAGMQTATLAVTAVAGGTPTPLPLLGNGQRPGLLSGTTTNAYGNVVVGATSAAVTWTITNTGDVATGVPALTIPAQSELVVGSNTCTAAIPGAGRCTISVSFRPSAAGARTGTLTLAATPGGSVTFTGTANGQTAAGLVYAATPSPAFGNVQVGATVDRTFVLTNTGQQTTTAVTVALAATAASGFSVLAATTGDCTTGTTLAGGASCNVRVRFTAPTTPGLQTATLSASAATGGAAPMLSLSGNSQRPAQLTGTTTFDFGNIVGGATSGSMTWTVTNAGDMATGVPVLTNGDPLEIMTSASTCTTALAGGGTCTISVSFKPNAVGARSGTLTLAATPGGSVTLTATATALTAAALTVGPATGSLADFGMVLVGDFQDETFVVTNGGQSPTSPITVTLASATDFMIMSQAGDCVSGTQTLAAGGVCLIHVRFLPTMALARTASLGVSASTGGSGDVTLTGQGQTRAMLSLTGQSTNLGYVLMPRTPTPGDSATATFVLRNAGDQAASGISIGLTAASGFSRGTGAPDDCGTSLGGGGKTCQIRVVFAPTVAGPATTTLSVTATVGGTTSSFIISGVGQPRPVFTEFPIPSGIGPAGIALAKDGTIWFTLPDDNSIGRLDPTTGVPTRYPTPTMMSKPVGIAAAADGSLWFTESTANRIGRVTWDDSTATAIITEFDTPVGTGPTGIVGAADGSFWFTESMGNGIGRMSAMGVYTPAMMLTPGATPQGITVGPDTNIWFTESAANAIGTVLLTTDSSIREFGIGVAAGPLGIASGADNRVWFTESTTNKIAAVTTGGTFSEYLIPTAGSQPTGITLGPDGNIWFVEQASSKIARITAGGVITEFAITSAGGTAQPHAPQSIVSGADTIGTLYFTDPGTNAIGRISFPP